MAEIAPITVDGAPAAEAAPAPDIPDRAIPTDDPGHVALTDPDGTVQSVPIENAETAVRQYGYRPSTDTEYYTAKTGTAGTVAAGLAGVGRGLSFGTFDPLAVAADRLIEGDQGAEEMRHTLRLLKEGHPTASTVGEIAGSLAPLAFGAPPATAAGSLGDGLLVRAAARAVQAAPTLLAEGVGMGLGQQLSEDTLGDHELVAGKYLAAGLEGGVLNLLLGAGLVAGGGALADKLATVASKGGAASTAAKSTIEKIEDAAAGQAFKATGAKIAAVEKLGKTAAEQEAGINRIGRTLLDEDIVTAAASKTDMAERVAQKVEKYGEEIGTLRKELDRSVIRPEVDPILKRIETEVVVPLQNKAFAQGELRAIEPYLQEIESRTAGKQAFGSFEELQSLRRDLADRIYPKSVKGAAPPSPPAGFEHLQKIERILEGEYETAAERAANDLGIEFSSKYDFAKQRYADLKTAERILSKETAREVANRAISLTDTIAGAGGLSTAATSLMAGHPIAAVASLALPAINKVVRTYGNQAAAFTINRIAKLEAIQRAAAAFDTKLASSVKAFYGAGTPPASSAKPLKVSPAQRAALRAAVNNSAVLTNHVANQLAQTGMQQAAPNIAAQVSQSVMRAATWAQQKLPREPAPVGVSFGPKVPRAIGPRAQAEMERGLSALDVDKTLDDLAHRRLSREQIEAVKFVNPPLFAAMAKAMRDYGMANDPNISIQQEMALAIMFNQPVSKYTQGATIRGFQQAFAQGAPSTPTQAGGPQLTPIGSGNSKAAQSLASPTDRMEASDAL